jgi:hypothetical protein
MGTFPDIIAWVKREKVKVEGKDREIKIDLGQT